MSPLPRMKIEELREAVRKIYSSMTGNRNQRPLSLGYDVSQRLL